MGGVDESEETGDRLTASAYHSFLPFKMMRMNEDALIHIITFSWNLFVDLLHFSFVV